MIIIVVAFFASFAFLFVAILSLGLLVHFWPLVTIAGLWILYKDWVRWREGRVARSSGMW